MASVEESRVDYSVDDAGFQGFLCVPKSKLTANANTKLPVVLVCHAFGGITEFEEGQTRKLAEMGYVAFATDCFGKGVKPSTREECFALLKPLREDRTGLLRSRLLAALEKVKSFSYVDHRKIGVIGYCFGGMCALDLARINCGVAAIVSFHGSFIPLPDQSKPEELEPIKASVLICHGDADTHIPMSQCQDMMAELRARRADWQFVFYGNAKHGFSEPKNASSIMEGIGYNKEAAHRSWAAMTDHLHSRFHSL